MLEKIENSPVLLHLKCTVFSLNKTCNVNWLSLTWTLTATASFPQRGTITWCKRWIHRIPLFETQSLVMFLHLVLEPPHMSNIHKQIRFVKPMVHWYQQKGMSFQWFCWWICISLRGLRLFSHVTWLGTGQFRWSIGTNGTIGTNRKWCHSNGSVGEYASE